MLVLRYAAPQRQNQTDGVGLKWEFHLFETDT